MMDVPVTLQFTQINGVEQELTDVSYPEFVMSIRSYEKEGGAGAISFIVDGEQYCCYSSDVLVCMRLEDMVRVYITLQSFSAIHNQITEKSEEILGTSCDACDNLERYYTDEIEEENT